MPLRKGCLFLISLDTFFVYKLFLYTVFSGCPALIDTTCKVVLLQ